MKIWENNNLFIEIHQSDIPWLKIFTKHPYVEMSQVPKNIRYEIYDTLDIIEKLMLQYYKPTKINIASFGNYMPHLHWHIMSRFKNDSHFPESMWGEKQRNDELNLPSIDGFVKILLENLSH